MSSKNKDNVTTPATDNARKRWLAIVGGPVRADRRGYGAYWALVLRYDQIDRRRLRQRQRRADHAADLRHGGRHRRRRHAVRQGRAAAGAARPGRRQGRARAGRGAARASTVRDVRNLFATSCAARRRPSQLRSADLARAPSDLDAPRAPRRSSGAVSGEELQHARDAVHGAQAALLARAAAARRQPRARRPHDARRIIRTCATPPRTVRDAYLDATRAPQLPAPVVGLRRQAQRCSSASASAPARR